jgi:hypothetical protein
LFLGSYFQSLKAVPNNETCIAAGDRKHAVYAIPLISDLGRRNEDEVAYLQGYLLCLVKPTNYMEQGPFLETDRSSASQEIPSIQRRPPPVRILSHINSVIAPIPLLEEPF